MKLIKNLNKIDIRSVTVLIPFFVYFFILLIQTPVFCKAAQEKIDTGPAKTQEKIKKEGNTNISLSIVSFPSPELKYPAKSDYKCRIAIRNTGNYPARIPFIWLREKYHHANIKVADPGVMIEKSRDGLFILPRSLEPGEEKQYTLNILPGRIGQETLTLQAGCQNTFSQPTDTTINFRIVSALKSKSEGWGLGEIAGLLVFIALAIVGGRILLKRRRKKATPHAPPHKLKPKPGKPVKSFVRLKPEQKPLPGTPIQSGKKADPEQEFKTLKLKMTFDEAGQVEVGKEEQRKPAKLILKSNVKEIESNGKDEVELTAQVLDQRSKPLVGQVVEFAAIDGGTITAPGKFTDSDGQVKALWLPEAGSEKKFRIGAFCPDYPDVNDSIFVKVVSV